MEKKTETTVVFRVWDLGFYGFTRFKWGFRVIRINKHFQAYPCGGKLDLLANSLLVLSKD